MKRQIENSPGNIIFSAFGVQNLQAEEVPIRNLIGLCSLPVIGWVKCLPIIINDRPK